MMNENTTRPPKRGIGTLETAILMIISLLAGVAITCVIGYVNTGHLPFKKPAYDTALLSQIIDDIENFYYFHDDAPSAEELVRIAAHEMVYGIGDPYADYFTEDEFTDFRENLNGNYKGIGVLISVEEGEGVLVRRAYEGNPAANAGVLDGDYITAVDGVSVIDMSAEDVSGLITGEDGTTVRLTIKRGEQTLEISVERGDVYVRRVYSEQLENGVGYIRIDSFTGTADTEFDEALNALIRGGASSLIIDIRDNPGGSLDSVIKIADRILPDCLITTLEGKTVDPPEEYRSTAEKSINLPLVVLTNGNSASASEILASAVQDNKAGTIIGTNTFGKGIVQTTWEVLSGQGYLKLTTDVYLTPNGKMIHGVGVAPDIVVEQAEELKDWDPFFIMRDMREKDLQLKAAIEFLTGR